MSCSTGWLPPRASAWAPGSMAPQARRRRSVRRCAPTRSCHRARRAATQQPATRRAGTRGPAAATAAAAVARAGAAHGGACRPPCCCCPGRRAAAAASEAVRARLLRVRARALRITSPVRAVARSSCSPRAHAVWPLCARALCALARVAPLALPLRLCCNAAPVAAPLHQSPQGSRTKCLCSRDDD